MRVVRWQSGPDGQFCGIAEKSIDPTESVGRYNEEPVVYVAVISDSV